MYESSMQNSRTIEEVKKFEGKLGKHLSHWSHHDELSSVESTVQKKWAMRKPSGLWVSVDGEFGWKKWAQSNDYCWPEGFAVHYRIKLADDSHVAIVNHENVEEFHERYRDKRASGIYGSDSLIRWERVAKDYQGIIISPYMWMHHLHGEISNWYYGWDCASGCIWDADAVQRVKRLKR